MNEKTLKALEKLPYSICVVTVGRGGVENGLTVSWLSQVSFDPPMLAISVDNQHYSIDLLKSTKNFVVNLLCEGQEKVAGHFAKRSMTDEQKTAAFSTREAPSGAAILSDALAYFDCEVVSHHVLGDHTLFVGRVDEAEVLNDEKPLTTFEGMRYRKKK